MIKVNGISERDMARAIDRISKERNKDGHEFKDTGIKGMENICNYCLMPHTKQN